jgi:hypothetical protein
MYDRTMGDAGHIDDPVLPVCLSLIPAHQNHYSGIRSFNMALR